MKVQFWGAAQTVTGSMHLVHINGKKLLLDCGLYQGKRKDAFTRNRELPFKGSEIDAVILSHAHIDHSGNLPSLIRSGYEGPIYSTAATHALATYLLLDSAKIQKSDVKYVNKKRKRKKQKPFEPLYLEEHAVQTINQFKQIKYEEFFEPLPGVKCRMHVAGHMLGAAVVEIVLEKEGQPIRLVFSGDIGRSEMPILRDPEIVEGANYVIMEGTYGNRNHKRGGDATQMLLDAAKRTIDQRGKLIIPAFSIGRTQEIVYRLNQLWESGDLPKMKVFVDSPLAVNATSVFRDKRHMDSFDEEMLKQILVQADEDPLAFGDLHYVRSAAISKEINKYKDPCIIISASGMCEAGRILHHLKHNISKPNTTIMFSGYQAPHTLGRIILEGTKDIIKIFGEPYEVKAQVCKLDASSGHADQRELLEWAKKVHEKGDLRKVALVHCELDGAEPLKKLLKENGIGPVIIPDRGSSMQLKTG